MVTGYSSDDLVQRLAWVAMGLVWPGRSLAGLNMSCQGTEQVAEQVAGEARGVRRNECTRREERAEKGTNGRLGLTAARRSGSTTDQVNRRGAWRAWWR